MYLHVVLDAVLKKQIGLSDVANPDILPSGLMGYYERHWQLMHSPDRAKRRGLQEPVICFLALAKKAVPAEVISEWMNDSHHFERVDTRDVEDLLDDEWAQFVHKEPGTPDSYRLYHRSFLEFLEKKVPLNRYGAMMAAAMGDKIDWE